MQSVGKPEQGIAMVRVLGGVHAVASDGSLVDLPSASQRRLLAVLALHSPRRLRSEWLADVLAVSPGALRTSVSRLRAKVGSDVLETASTGYALLGEVDADRFCRAVADAADADDRVEALLHALALWHGPALEEFAGEAWADGEIARLTEIHAGTVDDLAEGLIEAHRPTEAIALLEGQIARYPYRDHSRGLLVRSLASGGRQADALRAYQLYRSLMVEEFGTDPSPDVVRIERRVATGWDGVESALERAGARPVENADAIDLPLPPSLTPGGTFVGRAEELETLAAELGHAARSGLRCVVLTGEAGIGKTSLLATFARSAVSSASATVAYGRCDETGVSLQPFRSVLSACIEHAPSTMLNDHVARHGGELARICPALANRVPTMPAPTTSDDTTERFLAFEAAADFLRRVSAARPLVMLLDDLQWAEPTALLLLRHLARALADAPVLFVLSSRSADEHAPDGLRLALADIDRGATPRLHLAAFDRAELDDLVAATGSSNRGLPADQLVEALAARTAGNPLYAALLIRHWRDDRVDLDAVPASLRDIVWGRVTLVGGAAQQVLTAASVLGTDFYEDVLLDMVSLPETAVIETLDAAARAGLVIDAGSARRSLRFVHALVANALYTEIGSSERARLHGRAARALEKSVEELPPRAIVELARHCALAGWPAEAQAWSIRAGDYALAHLAPAEAAHHYRVALDIAIALGQPDAERADLLVRLGDAQHRSGDARALETLEEGALLARRSNAHDALVRAAIATDRGLLRADNRAPEYLELVESALAVTDPDDVATFARLRALLAQCLLYTPDSARRLAAAHEALDLATEHGDATLLAQVAPTVLYALWTPGRSELRSRVAARAIRAAEATGDPWLEFRAHMSAYNVAVETADHVVAARSLANLRAIAREITEPRLQWTMGLYETFEAMMAGRLDEAETLATEAFNLGAQIGAPDAFTLFAGEVFVIGTFAGRHEELLPLVEQAASDNPGVAPFKIAHAIVSVALGHEEVGRDMLNAGMPTRFSELAVDNMWMTSIIGYAVLAIELGDAEAAAHLLPIVEPFATEVAFNGVTSQGPVAAYAGKLASLLGLHEEAEQYLLAALDTATAFGWKYHRATTLLALAQNRHRKAGRLDAESESWLSEASELCRAGGFRSWIPQIEALAVLSPR